jgi:hypothetical protein
MCGPRGIWCTAWRLASEVLVFKAQASRQLYEIDGGLMMEMVKDFLGTLQMVAHLFRRMMGMDFSIFMCYYFLVFHE